MALQVRELTAEEASEVRRRAHSRTEPARVVERARIIWLVHEGMQVPAVAQAVAVTGMRIATPFVVEGSADGASLALPASQRFPVSPELTG